MLTTAGTTHPVAGRCGHRLRQASRPCAPRQGQGCVGSGPGGTRTLGRTAAVGALMMRVRPSLPTAVAGHGYESTPPAGHRGCARPANAAPATPLPSPGGPANARRGGRHVAAAPAGKVPTSVRPGPCRGQRSANFTRLSAYGRQGPPEIWPRTTGRSPGRQAICRPR